MVTDFFIALLCILLPLLAGSIVMKQPFLAWLFGSLFYFLLFLLVSFFASGELFLDSIRLVTIVATVVGCGFLLRRSPSLKVDRRILAFLGIVLLSVISFFFVWRQTTGYPLQLNWDIYEHITLIDILKTGKFSFFTSHLSDTFTFNSYPPFFHTMLALPLLFGGTSIGTYWWLEYFHYLGVILVTFFFVKEVFGNNRLAVFVATMTSALTFESFMVYESLFLLPQTLAAVVAIGLLTLVYRTPSVSRRTLVLGIVSLVFLHYVIGSAAALTILFVYFFLRLPIKNSYQQVCIVVAALIFAASIFGAFFLHWNVPGREEAQYFNLSLGEKAGYMLDWYAGFLLFLPVGFFVMLRKPDKKRTSLLLVSFLVLAVVFSPFSYVLKYHVLSRFFLHAVVGIGAASALLVFPRLFRPLVLVGLLTAGFLLFGSNIGRYKASLGYEGRVAHFSSAEMEAAKWLSLHSEEGMLLISEPATQYIFEALSGVNSQGGAFMDISTRKKLIALSYLTDPAQVLRELRSIDDLLPSSPTVRKRIFVLSGRYTKWQDLMDSWQESTYYNIWRPYQRDARDNNLRDALLSQPGVHLLYQNKEVTLLTL
ncbi:MAG: hypothetical protein Q8Q49_03735 [bacterium]|nr:hypothetical protein [bacterium]